MGRLPERVADPGAVFWPVLRGVDFGVDGPPERRLTCFIRAISLCVYVCGREKERRVGGVFQGVACERRQHAVSDSRDPRRTWARVFESKRLCFEISTPHSS